MRKGFFLAEMVVVIIVLVMISATLSRFFRTLAYELPRNSRLVEENSVLLSAVRYISDDVTGAKNIICDDSSGNSLLVIVLPDSTVSYELKDDRIIRSVINDYPGQSSEDIVWQIPHGKIEWRIWFRNDTSYAVEIITCLEDKDLGHLQKKMANNYLFFTSTLKGNAK